MLRFAAIDIGSNAMRLRIVAAERPPSTSSAPPGWDRSRPPWHEVLSSRAAVRLGSEVFASGDLSQSAINAACAVLREFRDHMDEHSVDTYRATATSAVREASNRMTLVERARRQAGIDLEIIEGVEEARLIQLAVTRALPLADKRVLLVDVGGGSTELTILHKGRATFQVSLPIGTVRLIAAFNPDGSAISGATRRLLEESVVRTLAEARVELTADPLDGVVGTGGNVETMADLAPASSGSTPMGRVIDMDAAGKLLKALGQLTAADRSKKYGLRPDRADTIIPAMTIFAGVSRIVGTNRVYAPAVGLKEGILTELVERRFDAWDESRAAENLILACERLGRRFHFDEAHGKLVAHLATRLFDDLRDLHGLGVRDRSLLSAAAMLHDIGDFVRYGGHHKHSFYLIQNSDIMGLSAAERMIVANVARYHRKAHPDAASHPQFRDLDKDARARVRALSALLRIADALDREHLGKITDVRAHVDGGTLKLQLEGSPERALEEWTVQAKSGLFRETFGLDLAIDPTQPHVAS